MCLEKRKLISNVIKNCTELYIKQHCLKSAVHLNAGYCRDFTVIVVAELKRYGFNPQILDIDKFWIDSDFKMIGNPSTYGKWNKSMLKRYNQTDYSDEIFNRMMYPPFHMWIYIDGKHYDAETFRGVESFFRLPYYSYYTDCDDAKKAEYVEYVNREGLEWLLG